MFPLFLIVSALAAPPPEAAELPEELATAYIEAMASIRTGDHQKVSDLLATVNEGAPDFDDAFRNRCAAERFLKHGDEARALCARAVAIEGSWVNHAALIRDSLAAQDLDAASRDVAVALAAHPEQLELLKLSCEVALATDDLDVLDDAIHELDSAQQDDPWTEFYRFAMHAKKGDREPAQIAMNRALELGIDQRGRRRMALIPLPPERAWLSGWLLGLSGGSVVMFGLAIFMWRRSR